MAKKTKTTKFKKPTGKVVSKLKELKAIERKIKALQKQEEEFLDKINAEVNAEALKVKFREKRKTMEEINKIYNEAEAIVKAAAQEIYSKYELPAKQEEYKKKYNELGTAKLKLEGAIEVLE